MPYGDRAYEHAKPRAPGEAENWTRDTPSGINELRKQEYEKRLKVFKKKEGLQAVGDLHPGKHEFQRGDTLYPILTKEFGMNRHTAFFVMTKMLENNVNVDLWRVGDEIELRDDGSLLFTRAGKEKEIKKILEPKAVSAPEPRLKPVQALPPIPAPAPSPAAGPAPAPAPAPPPTPGESAAPPERRAPPPDAALPPSAQPAPDAIPPERVALPQRTAPPERDTKPTEPTAAPAAGAPPERQAPPERDARQPAPSAPALLPPPEAPPERQAPPERGSPSDIRGRSADAFKEANSGKVESEIRAMSPEEKATYEKLKKSPLWSRILPQGAQRFYRYGLQQFPIRIKSGYIEIRVRGKSARGFPQTHDFLVYFDNPQEYDPAAVDRNIKEILDRMRSE